MVVFAFEELLRSWVTASFLKGMDKLRTFIWLCAFSYYLPLMEHYVWQISQHLPKKPLLLSLNMLKGVACTIFLSHIQHVAWNHVVCSTWCIRLRDWLFVYNIILCPSMYVHCVYVHVNVQVIAYLCGLFKGGFLCTSDNSVVSGNPIP